MVANTNISWATHTMNFWLGCDKVSPACDHCYAEDWAKRYGFPELWQGKRRRTKTWGDPPRWHRTAIKTGVRPSVFANSLSDFFDNHADCAPWQLAAWRVIFETAGVDYYLVTKRIPSVLKMLPQDFTKERYGHVVIIITVVNQAEWDRDGPRLKSLKNAYPWLRVGTSIEPMLGAIDLGPCGWLDWVICGGESGGNARQMKPAWARQLRDQCAAAGVPFHFKQWGEFHFDGQAWGSGLYGMQETPGSEPFGTRVGVKKSGRLLDGRTHDDGPRL